MLSEFWKFVKEEKVWWIAPLVVVLLLLVVAWFLGGSDRVLPYVYTVL